jgi:ribosomal protein L23
MAVKAYENTSISTRVIVEVGGICYLIVGTKATKATIKAAIDAILLKRSG